MTIGEILKAKRAEKKLTLEAVRKATRIQEHYITGLEENDPSVFAAPMYYKAFLRSYAKFLGLSGDELIEMFDDSQKVEEEKKEFIERPAPFRYDNFKFLISIILFLLMLAGFIYLSSALKADPSLKTTDRPPRVEVAAAESIVEEFLPEEEPEDAQEQEEPAAQMQTVIVRAVGKTWVRIEDLDGGKVLTERTLNAGERREWQSAKGFNVRLGHAPAAVVVFNGKRVDTGTASNFGPTTLTLTKDS